MRKFTRDGQLQTDKRVGLMNEILIAMDTIKYVWIRDWKNLFLIFK